MRIDGLACSMLLIRGGSRQLWAAAPPPVQLGFLLDLPSREVTRLHS